MTLLHGTLGSLLCNASGIIPELPPFRGSNDQHGCLMALRMQVWLTSPIAHQPKGNTHGIFRIFSIIPIEMLENTPLEIFIQVQAFGNRRSNSGNPLTRQPIVVEDWNLAPPAKEITTPWIQVRLYHIARWHYNDPELPPFRGSIDQHDERNPRTSGTDHMQKMVTIPTPHGRTKV